MQGRPSAARGRLPSQAPACTAPALRPAAPPSLPARPSGPGASRRRLGPGHVSRTPQQTTAKLAAFPPRVPNQTGKRVGGRLLPHGPFCPTVSCPCTVLARLPGLPGTPTWPAFPSFQAASPNALHGERTAPTQTPGAASASDLLRDPDRDRELGAVLLSLGPCTRRFEAFGPDQGGRRHLGLLPWGGDPGNGAAPTEDGQSSACSAASGGRVLAASPARLPRRRQPPTQPGSRRGRPSARLGASCPQDIACSPGSIASWPHVSPPGTERLGRCPPRGWGVQGAPPPAAARPPAQHFSPPLASGHLPCFWDQTLRCLGFLGGECDIHSLPVTAESLGVIQAIFATKPQGLSRHSGDPPTGLP